MKRVFLILLFPIIILTYRHYGVWRTKYKTNAPAKNKAITTNNAGLNPRVGVAAIKPNKSGPMTPENFSVIP